MYFPDTIFLQFKTTSIQNEENRVSLPRGHPKVEPGKSILWIIATPESTPDDEIASEQRCILYPVDRLPVQWDSDVFEIPDDVSDEAVTLSVIKMPKQYNISPTKITDIQTNYSITIPKSYFPDYKGKSSLGRQQIPLFNYGEEVFFVKTPLLWKAGKSFYMLDTDGFQALVDLDQDEFDDFIQDGGRDFKMNKYLDEGEVLDLQDNSILSVDEAIEILDDEAFYLDEDNYDSYRVYYGNDDGVVDLELLD